MAHEHHHHHDHLHLNGYSGDINKAFIIGIALNLLFVLVETGAGIYYDSMALVSDAGHNFVDVVSLLLALLSLKMSKIKKRDKLTYGYRKTTILASLINSVILFVAIGIIIKETIERFFNPVPVEGGAIVVVAAIGLVINSVTAYLFLKDKEKDINVKAAYLHLVADALVSLGVVISGLVIMFTGWYIIDTVISIIIVIVIFMSTWSLFKDSFNLTIDGVPRGIDINKIVECITSVEGVSEVHHIHVWALSTTENALTAHIVINDNLDMDKVAQLKNKIKQKLLDCGIHHSTLEFEIYKENCKDLKKH